MANLIREPDGEHEADLRTDEATSGSVAMEASHFDVGKPEAIAAACDPGSSGSVHTSKTSPTCPMAILAAMASGADTW